MPMPSRVQICDFYHNWLDFGLSKVDLFVRVENVRTGPRFQSWHSKSCPNLFKIGMWALLDVYDKMVCLDFAKVPQNGQRKMVATIFIWSFFALFWVWNFPACLYTSYRSQICKDISVWFCESKFARCFARKPFYAIFCPNFAHVIAIQNWFFVGFWLCGCRYYHYIDRLCVPRQFPKDIFCLPKMASKCYPFVCFLRFF